MRHGFASAVGSMWIALAVLVSAFPHAAKALEFDGSTNGVSLSGNRLLLGRDIGTLSFRVRIDAKSKQGPLIDMLGVSTGFTMTVTEDGAGLLFVSAASDGYTVSAPGLSDGAPHLISMQLLLGSAPGQGDDAWVVSVDGKKLGIVPGVLAGDAGGTPIDSDFTLAPDDRARLTLGGTDFVGTIDQFEIRTPDNLLYAQLSSAGLPIRRTLPILGTYLQTDQGVGIQQVNLMPRITNIHHGIFKKATYYALSQVSSKLGRNSRPDAIMLSVDWGAFVVMVPDPDNPDRYRPEQSGERWVGSLEFDSDAREPGRKVHFKSVGSQAVNTRPFLQDGKFYDLAPARPDGIDKADAMGIAKAAPRQTSGFVFNIGGTPPNFNFSLNGCYNVIDMNLENFQETGCPSLPIFAAPDREGAYKAVPPHILPLGWNWLVDSASEESSKSSLATSAQELNSALTGGESSDFSALGYSVQHNKKTEHEQSNLTSSEQMESVQQYFRRAQSIVLAPTEVELDSCLIHSVLRGAATAFAAAKGVTVDQLPEWAMPQGPSYYDPVEAEERCEGSRRDPLTPQMLLSKYGTHYAAAITFGSRTIQKSRYSMSTIRSLISDSAELSDAEGFEFNANITAGNGKSSVSIPVKIGKTTASTSNNGTSSSNETSAKRESASIICYGSPCAAGLPQDGTLPIPMYLDLVRFDYLLAPPFFSDPLVIAALRPAVAQELDHMLMEEDRSSLLSALRVIDVELKTANCWERPNYPREQNDTAQQVCELIETAGSLSAFTTKPGGGQQHVDLMPVDVDGGDGVPPIPELKQCVDGSKSPTCAHRKFRMILDPHVEKSGASLADDSIIGFMLTPNASFSTQSPSQYAQTMLDQLGLYDENSSCGQACAGQAIARNWGFDRPTYSKALYLYRGMPTPRSLSGDVFIQADASTKEKVFGYNITLSLEENIAGVLGYASAGQDPAKPEIVSLDSINPGASPKGFAWQAEDGMVDNIPNFVPARKRCEAEFGYGNCELKAAIYWSKPPEQRSFPKPYERS